MPITANSPQPTGPKRKRANIWSWLIFLLILARPLYAIATSIVPVQFNSLPIGPIVGGVVVLGLVVALVVNTARRRSNDTWLPTPASPPVQTNQRTMSSQPAMKMPKPSNPSLPSSRSNLPRSTIPSGAPRYEPMVTGKAVLAGIITGGIIAAAVVFLWVLAIS